MRWSRPKVQKVQKRNGYLKKWKQLTQTIRTGPVKGYNDNEWHNEKWVLAKRRRFVKALNVEPGAEKWTKKK